jgi:hypothetical protein
MMRDKKYFIISFIFILFLSFSVFFNAKPRNTSSVIQTILEEGNNIALKDTHPVISIFTNHNEFDAFYSRIHINKRPVPSPPKVDFTESAILFISYGEQKTAGYSINVRSVFKRNDTLIVKAVLISPPQDVFTAQVITNPYVLLTVPAGDYSRVELRNDIGEVLDFKNL